MTEGKKRKLIIKDCKIDDTAGITVKVPGDESSAPLNVARKSTNILIIMVAKPQLSDQYTLRQNSLKFARISCKQHIEEGLVLHLNNIHTYSALILNLDPFILLSHALNETTNFILQPSVQHFFMIITSIIFRAPELQILQ